MPTGPASRLMPKLRRVVLAGAVSDRTDGQLLGAFVASRDADAFAGLVRRHGPMVLGVCRRVTGNHTTADDAFQAVFLVLARRAAAIKPREQVGNWLYGVAYRTAIKARAVLARRWSREKQVDVMPEPPVTAHPDVWSDLQPVIDEELTRLPDNLRIPIVLCDLEGRAQREVAKHLGVPLATLASRIATARRTLAQRLTRRGVTLSGGALAGLLTTHGTVAAVSHSLAYGLAQAAETVASGGIVTSLVSSHAIQLSEGVIRMMLLTKLKAVAVTALTVVALTGGLGLGLVPAAAGDDPALTPTEKPAVSSPTQNSSAKPANNQTVEVVVNEHYFDAREVDDLTFLRRLTLDLRGTPPTDVETWLFIADQDTDKRTKVAEWLTEDDAIVARLVKELNIPADKVRLVHVTAVKDGKPVTLVAIAVDGEQEDKQPLSTHYRRVRLTKTADDQTTNSTSGARKTVTVGDGDKVLLWKARTEKESDVQLLREVIIATEDNIAKSSGTTKRFVQKQITGDVVTQITPVLDTVFTSDVTLGVTQQLLVVEDGDNVRKTVVVVEGDNLKNSDSEFLKRVLLDVRGTPPTSLEERYFTEDKDPKKREKLLDTLLKDPTVAKKLGEEWKKKMLGTPQNTARAPVQLEWKFFDPKGVEIKPAPEKPKTPQPGQTFQLELKGIDIIPAPANPKAPPQPEQPFLFKFVEPAAPTPVNPKEAKPPVVRVVVQEGTTQTPANPTVSKPPVARVVVPDGTPQTPATPKTPKTPTPPQPPTVTLPPLTWTVVPDGTPQTPATPKTPKTPTPPQPPTAPQQSQLEKLVSDLLAAKKSDAEMLEAVTLATARRLPTDTEKRLTLGLVAKTTDRKAAWIEVAKALAGTEEGPKRGEAELRFVPKVVEVIVPQVKP